MLSELFLHYKTLALLIPMKVTQGKKKCQMLSKLSIWF